MSYATADISDADPSASQLCDAPWRDYGRHRAFWGQAVTLQVLGDYRAAAPLCQEPGRGRILVIDGGGQCDLALVGGTLSEIAARNGWAGIVAFGAVRDAEELARCELGVKALGTTPRSAPYAAPYMRDVVLHIGGAEIRPGDWIYADSDGVLVRRTEYEPPSFDYGLRASGH